LITDPYHPAWEPWLQRWFLPLLVPAILVNAGGLLIPVMEPDGALYATIAKTMARSGDFVHLFVNGRDWLDKPHFPFWMAALSFRVFGVNGFAYKFPALLFWGAGAWYTWRLARSLYGKPVAQLATLIYVSAAHLVISNNDVRAEPYLTGLLIGSVYHFYRLSRGRSWVHLVAGSALAAAAVMTKGPFVLLVIGAAFAVDWSVGKEWRRPLQIRWWLATALTALLILPELYCLYVQFDLHPEKQVFGQTGVSGIRFFFWGSQFGRFFNNGPIRGSGDPFFYFHTVLWAFLPWSVLLYAAVIRRFRSPRRAVPGDWICAGGALAGFALFSLSRFQLPHYLNILFPSFAILTAAWLFGIRRAWERRFVRIVQHIVSLLLPFLLLLLTVISRFPGWPWVMAGITVLAVLPWIFIRGGEGPGLAGKEGPGLEGKGVLGLEGKAVPGREGKSVSGPVARSFWMALLAYGFVNFFLYPAILQYQAGTQAGRWLGRRAGIPAVYLLREAPVDYSIEFDSPVPVRVVPTDSLSGVLARGPVTVFAPLSYGDTLAGKGFRVEVLRQFPNFHISRLTGEFLDARTRPEVLESYALLTIR